MCVFLQPIVARGSRVSPSDESPDLRDERLGIYVADMSGGRHRKARLRTVCGLPGRMVGRIQ